nr:DNA-directed DNA polymerase [Tanacetum cinerariifolium]
MADNRTKEEILQAPTEGYGDAILVPDILAENFEIRTGLLSLIQANQFHGFESNNPHDHIRSFNRITSTLKFRNVPNDAIKLMLFPYSLEGGTKIWYEKEPPRSILTWGDLVRILQKSQENQTKTDTRTERCMRTRNSYFLNNSSTTIPIRRNKRCTPNIVEPKLRTIVGMADNRTMKELLQAPTEGYGEAIVILEINADHFEIKTNLLQLVQANPYHGFERENPYTHINNFKRITSNIKFRDVPNDMIMLMMFSYSLEGNARVWYDKEPPNSILTWEDLVNKFVNQFFPPSKTTHLKNKISCFTQRFEETFGEAWERFKKMLRACPHHGFIELAQIDTFYNGLNDNDQDSLNAAAGGNLLSNTTREALQIIENKSKVLYSRNKPNFYRMSTTSRDNASKSDDRIDKLADQISTLVDIFAKKIVTPALVKAVEESCVTCGGAHAYYNCPNTDSNQPSVCVEMGTYNQVAPQNRASNYMAPSGFAPVQNNQNRMLLKKLPEKLGDPGKFLIPCDFSRIDVCHALADLGASINLMPLSIWKKLSLPELTPTRMTLELADRSITRPKGVAEHVFVKVGKFHFLIDFVVVDFEADPRVNDEAVTFNLNQTTRYSSTNSSGGNPTSTFEPILFYSSPSFTPFEGSDFILEEIDAYLKDESISSEIDHADCDPEGDICLIEKLLNNYPFQLPPIDLKQGKVVKEKSSIKEPPELEFKVDEKEALLKVLKSHKRAIAWKITDIKGIDPRFCSHKILIEGDYKPAVQSQRRVKPKIHEVIKKEVIKLLDAGMIYPIFDSSWVSLIHCVPKKGGITVVENKNNELIPTWLVTGWRVCIDYRKLNDATCKDHFPLSLPFMDQMLEGLTGNEFYCFLDGFSGYFQILINPPDQEKTTFTCPYDTFAYRRMPYGLCNAPGTFQRCMMAIFHDMIKKTMEVFMDDFSVFGNSFSSCLSHLDTMLQRPMTHLHEKETPFVFSKDCIDAFETLKKKLTKSPILVVPNWNLPFKLMCDASDFAIGAVLGQRKTKHFKPIHYASKTMTEAQIHYTTTKTKMLAVVYAFEKFRPYLVLSKSIVYTDHSALKYLLRTENLPTDHLSRLKNPHKDVFENKDINENFPLETLGKISNGSTPWFADFENFHAGNFIVKGMSTQPKKKFFKDVKHYFWDDPYLFWILDYLSKWVEAKALPTNDARVVVNFLKSLFARFGTPRAIISNCGTYFCNDKFAKVMSNYGVTHHLSTAYHPQTSGQVEVSNRGLKRILEKTVRENRASWSEKLDDALWAFRTAYKTPIGALLISDHQMLQLNELNELRDQAYDNSLICKEKTKKIHDSNIKTTFLMLVIGFYSSILVLRYSWESLKLAAQDLLPSPKFFHMGPLSYLNRMVQTLR